MNKEPIHATGLLLDVDGTLANTQRVVSSKTQEAITKLSNKGMKIGTSTGRSYAALFRYILPLFAQDSLHIVSGGGQIVSGEGKIAWEKKISSPDAIKICNKIERMGADYAFGRGPVLYCTNKLLPNFLNHPWKIDAMTAEKLTDWSTPLISVMNINQEVQKYLSENNSITIKKIETAYRPPYIDITALDVNKGTTASIWSEKINIPLANTISVGDSINDIDIFQVTGLSVAMGQSPNSVKAVAKKIIGNVDEDGLADYLESLI